MAHEIPKAIIGNKRKIITEHSSNASPSRTEASPLKHVKKKSKSGKSW